MILDLSGLMNWTIYIGERVSMIKTVLSTFLLTRKQYGCIKIKSEVSNIKDYQQNLYHSKWIQEH